MGRTTGTADPFGTFPPNTIHCYRRTYRRNIEPTWAKVRVTKVVTKTLTDLYRATAGSVTLRSTTQQSRCSKSHVEMMRARARNVDAELRPDAFLFSAAQVAMRAGHVRPRQLKYYTGNVADADRALPAAVSSLVGAGR